MRSGFETSAIGRAVTYVATAASATKFVWVTAVLSVTVLSSSPMTTTWCWTSFISIESRQSGVCLFISKIELTFHLFSNNNYQVKLLHSFKTSDGSQCSGHLSFEAIAKVCCQCSWVNWSANSNATIDTPETEAPQPVDKPSSVQAEAVEDGPQAARTRLLERVIKGSALTAQQKLEQIRS